MPKRIGFAVSLDLRLCERDIGLNEAEQSVAELTRIIAIVKNIIIKVKLN